MEEIYNYSQVGSGWHREWAREGEERTFQRFLTVCNELLAGPLQDDLENDDVCLMDTFSQFFIWIGHGANDKEKEAAMEVATK